MSEPQFGPWRGRKVAILSSVHQALDNRVFYREARTLAAAGYDVTLVAVHDRDEVKDGIRIVSLPRVRRWQRPWLWARLVDIARRLDADSYHIQDPELLLVTPWLRILTGKPTIYDIHESYAEFVMVKDYLPAWLRRPLSRLVATLEPRLASNESALIFADDAIARDFETVDRLKVTLFNYPGSALLASAAGSDHDYTQREPVVLYLGGLEGNRGAGLMPAAFAEVLRLVPEARLLVVGHFAPPELQDELLAESVRLGINHAVTVTGRVPFEQIGHYLRRARIGWITWQPVPKNSKNIPTKLFEYMAYSLPVVASDLRSIRPYVIPDVNGILVEPADPAAHAEAITRLLRNTKEAAAMGRAGRQLVETRYNWAAMEPVLLSLYELLLS